MYIPNTAVIESIKTISNNPLKFLVNYDREEFRFLRYSLNIYLGRYLGKDVIHVWVRAYPSGILGKNNDIDLIIFIIISIIFI